DALCCHSLYLRSGTNYCGRLHFPRYGKSVGSKTAEQRSRQHGRDKETAERRPIGAAMIKCESHDERSDTACQNESAECKPERRAHPAQPKITAHKVRNNIAPGPKSKPHQEHAQERRRGGGAGPQQSNTEGGARKNEQRHVRTKIPVQEKAGSSSACQQGEPHQRNS